MDRRRFLGACARALGASLLWPAARILGEEIPTVESAEVPVPVSPALDLPDLVLARGEAVSATHAALKALGGMERFVKADDVVVLKPNASFDRPPAWGVTTHPAVLSAVLAACFEAGAKRVFVVDHTMNDPQRCFERNGTAEAVAGFPKAKLVSLDKEKLYRPVPVPAGKVLHETRIPHVLQKADVFINLPTAKAHSATQLSLGLKNLMGLIWDRHVFHQDMDIQAAIADLATVLRPQLTLIDAMHILKSGGPVGPGPVDDFGGVVAGVDPVAVDAYGVGLSPWNGQTLKADQVPYLQKAAEHELGVLDLKSLRIKELT